MLAPKHDPNYCSNQLCSASAFLSTRHCSSRLLHDLGLHVKGSDGCVRRHSSFHRFFCTSSFFLEVTAALSQTGNAFKPIFLP